MEPQALTVKDIWDIGIGISSIVLTLIAVGIAIYVPYKQRKDELAQRKEQANATAVAILSYVLNDLFMLSKQVFEMTALEESTIKEFCRLHGYEYFTLELPKRLKEIRDTPSLLEASPPYLQLVIWSVTEIDLCVKVYRDVGFESTPVKRFLFLYNDLEKYMGELEEFTFNFGEQIKKSYRYRLD